MDIEFNYKGDPIGGVITNCEYIRNGDLLEHTLTYLSIGWSRACRNTKTSFIKACRLKLQHHYEIIYTLRLSFCYLEATRLK